MYKMWLFCLVKEYGNFKEAANHASITRSALSQNLTILEDYFGKAFLIRERGTVSLTHDGQDFYNKVKPILDQGQELGRDFLPSDELKGNFKLGSYESLAVRFLPKLFNTFRTLHPNFKIDVITSRSDSLVKQVKNGTINMAMVINGEEDSKVDVEHISSDTLGLYVCAEKYCYTENLEEIIEMGIAILSTPEDGLPYYYKKFTQKIPDEYKVTLTCDSFEAIRSVTASGTIIGLLPEKVAKNQADSLKKIWPLDDEISKISQHNVSIIYRKSTDKRIVDLIKKVIS